MASSTSPPVLPARSVLCVLCTLGPVVCVFAVVGRLVGDPGCSRALAAVAAAAAVADVGTAVAVVVVVESTGHPLHVGVYCGSCRGE